MTSEPLVVSRLARAKINLYLHITGKRPDGYHLLDSLVAFTEAGDSVTVTKADNLSLEITGPFAADLATENDNLVLRAARALASAIGHPPEAHIALEKNLPIASGIGGGSADAAATLLALNELWENHAEKSVLSDIGLSLGADIPVCLMSETAQMSGIGETVIPGPGMPQIPILLINPMKPVSTPAVFAARNSEFSAPSPLIQPIESVGGLAEFLMLRRNDLETAACTVEPEIIEVLCALREATGCMLARMSGSGATCFGLFSNDHETQEAASQIAKIYPDWWLAPTCLVA